jgi:diguanylate cyclase
MDTPTITSFVNFETAVKTVLDFLHQRIGFKLWMFTRVQGDDWIVLSVSDHGYGVQSGEVFNWSDSFCSRMVEGLGPRIAPESEAIKAYLEAPIAQIVPIKAYIGIPLCDRDGSLFGTLCAIDPQTQPEYICKEEALIELQAKLLTTILHYELTAQENARLYERAQREAETDWLPNIYNGKGWRRILEAEEIRCKTYGQSAGIIIVDLDNLKVINDKQGHAAGDLLLKATGECLLNNIRQGDIVARWGGDEFGILLLNIDKVQLAIIAQRITQQLEVNQISASLGYAQRSPQSDIWETMKIADKKMYEQKQQRKQLKSTAVDHLI